MQCSEGPCVIAYHPAWKLASALQQPCLFRTIAVPCSVVLQCRPEGREEEQKKPYFLLRFIGLLYKSLLLLQYTVRGYSYAEHDLHLQRLFAWRLE